MCSVTTSEVNSLRAMITMFAVPKPFRGHHGIIQRNAIRSWTCLRPRPEILLFGAEEGTAEICREFGLRHLPEVATNEFGVPLMSSLFFRAEQLASEEILGYVNSDIILLSDFADAVREVRNLKRKFLLVGRRWNLSVSHLWDFGAPDWEERLRDLIRQQGWQAPPPGNSDYFVFPGRLWTSIPPLAIGRAGIDPWLVYEACRLGAAVLDASSAIQAVHQSHEHILQASAADLRKYRAATRENGELVGVDAARFTLLDASLVLTPRGLARPRGWRYWVRAYDRWRLFHPAMALPLRLLTAVRNFATTWMSCRHLRHDPESRIFKLISSLLPPDGIPGIIGLAEPQRRTNAGEARGIRLAGRLLGVGLPAVVYDPSPEVREKTRLNLRGPVSFAASLEECVQDSDVLVIATAHPEIRARLISCLASHPQVRAVIDSCALLNETVFAGKTTRYVPFRW